MATSTVFGILPAVSMDRIIDLKEKTGQIIFQSSTQKIDEELYDCHPNRMSQLLQSLAVWAFEYRWDHENNRIVCIPEDPSKTISETNNLIKNYGMISIEKVMAFESSYINWEVRPEQDTYILFNCLMNAILGKEIPISICLNTSNTWMVFPLITSYWKKMWRYQRSAPSWVCSTPTYCQLVGT